MKYILSTIAGLGLLAAGTAANASDAPKGAIYNTVSATSWAGGYIGLQAGYGWGDTHQFSNTGGSLEHDWSGFVGGATAGYNWQRGMWVYGLEGDISFSDIDVAFPSGGSWGCGIGPCRNEVDWFGTLRARIGWATGNFMPYVTGGLAFGRVSAEFGGGCVPGNCVEETEFGWTAGGGVEWMINNKWSAKVEYLYVDLGDSYDAPSNLGLESNFNVIRGGVNYWFR